MERSALHHQPDHQSALAFAPFVRGDEKGLQHLVLSVNGIKCASCVQRIESTLAREPDMAEARVNFSTQRLNLVWKGTAAQADHLAAVVEQLGFGVRPFDSTVNHTESDREANFLLLCLAVAGFGMGNIMLMSVPLWTSTTEVMGFATREFMHWMSALIAIPIVLYSGRPFFRSAFAALSKGHTNMDVPISVGLVLTTTLSIVETMRGAEHAYFDSVVMLIFFLLVGRYLDFRARRTARAAASDLLAMLAGTALVIENGQPRRIAIRELVAGMRVDVAMGERIPADALVIEGTSTLDTSLVTGESLPQPVGKGEPVYSGMLNLSAPLSLQISRPADNSLLADIVRLMEKAEQGQARYVRIADRAARFYTPVVHLLALLTFLAWVFIGHMAWQPALIIAVSVLIITCPCALGLAVPVVQVLATSLLMKRGVLVKSGDAFERLAAIDALLLDKTGTLTVGHPELVDPQSYPSAQLALAVSLARKSRHPLSKALAAAFTGPVADLDVAEFPGEGLAATVAGQQVRLGSRLWCYAPQADGNVDHLELWLAIDGKPQCRFIFADPLRSDAAVTLRALEAAGLNLHLLSGDRPEAVAHVAGVLGLAKAQGGLKPADKYDFLEQLKAAGHKVGMVGDGLNDAPVLSGADIALSPSTAIDMAQNAADIVFMGDRLDAVRLALVTARRTQQLVRDNFLISIAYNIVAIPMAMAGYVTPFIAALAMSSSSIIVIINSFRLKRGL